MCWCCGLWNLKPCRPLQIKNFPFSQTSGKVNIFFGRSAVGGPPQECSATLSKCKHFSSVLYRSVNGGKKFSRADINHCLPKPLLPTITYFHTVPSSSLWRSREFVSLFSIFIGSEFFPSSGFSVKWGLFSFFPRYNSL